MAMTVWKSKKTMNPLGKSLFPDKTATANHFTRSVTSNDASQPVHGYPLIATNLMAKTWNSVPDLSSATKLSEAKRKSWKWAKTLPNF